MPCTWQKEDYFSLLMCSDKRSHTALEMLVDDLHTEKERTVHVFLSHSGSEDFLWGLVRLLGNDTARVAGNAAYILGTLAETELGCMRVLSLAKHGSSESRKILPDLTRMLTFDDSESVMNAAGTMGTLAESHEGREWILQEKCLHLTLEHITALLHSENLWTASNAALVLARLSIAEFGCTQMLQHGNSQNILSKLILSLGVDEAGRGMNAAFAIGRLCDMDQGRKRLLQLGESERMISSLARMLSCDDTGASKNACFALSCLATNSEGHARLLSNLHSDDILRTLSNLLNAEDSETGWFAAMTLRTLASQPRGCLRLRDQPHVISSLKTVEAKNDVNPDLKEEAIITLEILKRLSKPSAPVIQLLSSSTIKATWEPIITKSGFQVRYQLFDGTKCVYTGKQAECEVTGLQPSTPYIYKVRAYTEGDESPFSDIVSIVTEESVPGPPQSVRILGSTITQLKVGWDPPEEINGILKGYHVYLGDKEVQHVTTDLNVIITGLTANTTYEIQVCAATAKGRGEKSEVVGTTNEIGAHAPSKPHVNVIGRNELHVSWSAPEVPLGRLNRYDVIMNDKILYSGSDLNLPVRRLTPDTEYCFVIVALTSEGKFESKLTKKRTAKDEYDSARPPLYQTPKKEAQDETDSRTPTNPTPVSNKKRKSISSAHRTSSAKASGRRVGTGKERSKSSAASEPRPISAASSVLSAQDTVVDHSVTPVPTESSGPSRSTPSPQVGKPIAEVRYEPPRPVSKTRTTRTVNKIERNTNSAKGQKPVVMSTVSMQGNKKENADNDDKPTVESNQTVKKGSKTEKDSNVIVNNVMKMERSRTVVNNREMKKGKYSNNTLNGRVASETKLSDRNEARRKSAKGIGSEKLQNSNGGMRMKFTESDFKHDMVITSSDSKGKVGDHQGKFGDHHHSNAAEAKERHSKHSNSYDRNRTSKENTKGHTMESVLPKPSPPSQKYLEGVNGLQSESPWGHRSLPTPRSSDNLDTDWLTQVKRVSETYSRGVNHPNHFDLCNPADSTYYIEPSHFLQRTNTYINSHRQKLLPGGGGNSAMCNRFPTLPCIESDLRRPTGRRSLEKLQKSTPNMKMSVPVKMGASLNFEADIPDTSSKLANKFIPMQLRTQPANLGLGQLQRVNTTLLQDVSDNSVSFRRLEAMTRSHTQIELRQQQPQVQPVIPPQMSPDNKRDLGLLMTKERERTHLTKKSGSTQKVQKLSGSVPNQRHSKEPDSVLLQQSWGINNSQDLGAMQNVR